MGRTAGKRQEKYQWKWKSLGSEVGWEGFGWEKGRALCKLGIATISMSIWDIHCKKETGNGLVCV